MNLFKYLLALLFFVCISVWFQSLLTQVQSDVNSFDEDSSDDSTVIEAEHVAALSMTKLIWKSLRSRTNRIYTWCEGTFELNFSLVLKNDFQIKI